MLATGLGSQAYWREVLSTGHSFIGILARSLLIQVAVRCECRVAIVVEYRAHLLVGRWIAGILAQSFSRVIIAGVLALLVC